MGVTVDLKNNFNSTLLVALASLGLTLFSACNSKMGSQIKDKNPSATVITEKEIVEKPASKRPQPLVSTSNEYDSLSEEEKEKYEPPAKHVKFKQHFIIRGETKFTDVVYTAEDAGVKITGRLQLKKQIENISPDDIFDFELKGTIEQNNRQIIIKAYDVDNRKSTRVRLGARVICLNLSEKNEVDCSQAVVDFIVQIKETKLMDQFKTIPEPPAPEPIVEPAPSPAQPPVSDDITPPVDDPTTIPQSPETPSTPNTDEPNQVPEGKDLSLNGAVNTHIDSDDDVDVILAENPPTPLLPPKDDEQTDPDPIKPKPKIIKDGLLITGDGILRPFDQAVNFPDNGKLVQSTNLILQQRQLKEDQFYFIVHPDRDKSYGTFEAGLLISKLGQFAHKNFQKRIAVGNMSLARGGKSPPHLSHQNGTDADIGYPTDAQNVWFPTVVQFVKPNKNAASDDLIRKFYPSAYSPEKTLKLLEYAFTQKDVGIDRIFMDQYIIDDLCQYAKRNQFFNPASSDPKWNEKNEFWKSVFRSIQHVDGHGDHMHLRIKCGPLQRACQPKIYRKMTHCQS
jgi:murein endopeptidase